MDWTQAYAEGTTPWDLAQVTPPLRALLRSGLHRGLGLPERPRVAVPGCGRGHDLRAWAEAGARVTGFDIVPDAVQEARALLCWNRVPGVSVLCRDALGFGEEFRGQFDLVYDYTCFCALTPALRGAYLREIAKVLVPDGVYLLLAFPLGGPSAAIPTRPPHPILREELDVLLQPPEFERLTEIDATDSVPLRSGEERWFAWRRC